MKNKVVFGSILILVIAVIGFFIYFKLPPSHLLGKDAILTRTAIGGVNTNHGSIILPFEIPGRTKEMTGLWINVAFDFNHDGEFKDYDVNGETQPEWAIINFIPQVIDGEANSLPLKIVDDSIDTQKIINATAVFSNHKIEAGAWPKNFSKGDIIENFTINEITTASIDGTLELDPELLTGSPISNSKLAFSLPHESDIDSAGNERPYNFHIQVPGVPDIDQDYNECGPTAVANSFRYLADRYNFEDLLPPENEQLIDELKGDLQFEDGVRDENILAGKQTFVERRGLPLEVHQVGDINDPDIVFKIYEELKKGQMVEATLQFFDVLPDGTEKRAGGHVVTVIGASGTGSDRLLTFSDPGDAKPSPSRDIFQMRQNEVQNFWSGKKTIISLVVAQSPIPSVLDYTWVDPSSQIEMIAGEVIRTGIDLSQGTSKFNFFNVTMDDPGDHLVGDAFTARAVVTKLDDREDWVFYTNADGEDAIYRHKVGEWWSLTGNWKASGNISPAELNDRPPRTSTNQRRYAIDIEFTCEKPGPAWIALDVLISWDEITVPENSDIPPEVNGWQREHLLPADRVKIATPPFRCRTNNSGRAADDGSGLDIRSADESGMNCPGAKLLSPALGGTEIEVWKVAPSNLCFRREQFIGKTPADACDEVHYHTQLLSLGGGAVLNDSQPCGATKESQIIKKGFIWVDPDSLEN
ncbi:MAG: hypothetical protein COT81_03210 [Candidatus Buchananbacteria bacterium CG10_big_fil_rev_8_21_14_0_10_42_9]|uniref:Uncharacterized protein n=1 Tax=Candidatus Buchananbacteria bacterium CG10_big_fil_rev_8_21_14_0_10_42_9 TaxID=1974526 RepID=A0A2H0W0Z8_9BACT|nr:MAG: hypothetical protein COT81_03210 [Candidatus Buchananbacteria bacterium CG10_big_fil_rev_8_21_14_0_10_42_9]